MTRKDVSNSVIVPARTPSLWRADKLRFITMYAKPVVPDSQDWFNAVGEKPARDTNVQQIPMIQQDGPWKRGNLSARRTTTQFEWVYQPDATNNTDPLDAAAGIGTYSEARDVFIPLISKWLLKSIAPHRIAFVATILQPATTWSEGYSKLSEYLPSLKIDAEHSFDLYYRINRPKTYGSGRSEFYLNRISSWDVVELSAQTDMSIRSLSLRAELDINTQRGLSDPIPKSRIKEVFRQMVECANAITEKGDF